MTNLAKSAGGALGRYGRDHYHQQYLHEVPNRYCGLGGAGISCPVGGVKSSER